MASSTNLEERFNAAVKTIQNLPSNGIIQPSNLTKLIFYGLYKQATVGPCKESQPSLFNYIARAKWEAWNRYRSMTKEQAMLEYIDEIRKIVETMPQTTEVLEFSQLIGLSNKSNDQQSSNNNLIPVTESLQQQQKTEIKNKENNLKSVVNDINENNHKEHPIVNIDNPTETIISAKNDPVLLPPSSSPSSLSSISSSDVDEFYDDPSDLPSFTHDEITLNNNIRQQSIATPIHHYSPPRFDNHNETNVPVRHSIRSGNNHTNVSSSSIASAREHEYILTNNYNKETQRAILTALIKLQQDIHNILERLNQLETSANFLQQRQLSTSLKFNSSLRWLPLSGLRRGAIAFILFWPFIAFILIRLFLRAKIIIRFRRQSL